MQISKLVKLIVKIFVYSFLANSVIFFVFFYADAALINMVLPYNTHINTGMADAINFALYNSLELSLFFTTFTLLIIRLSILSGVILTVRDIIRYHKKFIFTTVIFIALSGCVLCVVFSNLSLGLKYIGYSLMSGEITTYSLPCFWLILAAVYYRSYQSKISEPDGSKDRSWLEGSIEK